MNLHAAALSCCFSRTCGVAGFSDNPGAVESVAEFSENPAAVESGVAEFPEIPAAVKFLTAAGFSHTKFN